MLNRHDLFRRISRVKSSLRTWICEDLKTTLTKTSCRLFSTNRLQKSYQQIISSRIYSRKVELIISSSMSKIECLHAKLRLHILALQQAIEASLEASLKHSSLVLVIIIIIMWVLPTNKSLSMDRWVSRGQLRARQIL